MTLFQKAVKEQAKLRLAIAGPSGSGKTYTALALATNLGDKVALVDTEHGSASKYADIFEFDTAEMHAPFHPDKFGKAIDAAAEAGYDVLILDSLSHAWNGPGGLLEIVDAAARKYKGNTYAAWSEGTPIHNRLIESIIQADLHIIATMRSKTDYILVEDGRGKQRPQKVGMAPVQRDGMEYEFDVFLDMDIENNAIVTKTRCPELTGEVISKPGADLAATLAEWLGGAPKREKPKDKKRQPKPEPQPETNGDKPPQANQGPPPSWMNEGGEAPKANGDIDWKAKGVGKGWPTFSSCLVNAGVGYNHANHVENALADMGEDFDGSAEQWDRLVERKKEEA